MSLNDSFIELHLTTSEYITANFHLISEQDISILTLTLLIRISYTQSIKCGT